jgi:hypothetical protein
MGFVIEKEDGKRVAIDHERGIRLKTLMNGREGDYTFELKIGAAALRINALYKGKIYSTPKVPGEQRLEDVIWDIETVSSIEKTGLPKEEVMKIITEALEARGWDYSQERVHSVQVGFNTGSFDRRI